MIKINLLPQEMMGAGVQRSGSIGGGSAPGIIVAAVLIILFGANVSVAGYIYLRWSAASTEYATEKAKSDKVKADLKKTQVDYESTRASVDRMEKLISVANSLDPAERVLWARKLNMLPSLVPEGIFLTEISITRRVVQKETQESIKARAEWEKKKKGEAPAKIENPVYTQTLVLKGISYVPQGLDTQRLDQIIVFFKNLSEKKVKLPAEKTEVGFMEGLTVITPSPVTQSTLEGRDVSTFVFTIGATPTVVK